MAAFTLLIITFEAMHMVLSIWSITFWDGVSGQRKAIWFGWSTPLLSAKAHQELWRASSRQRRSLYPAVMKRTDSQLGCCGFRNHSCCKNQQKSTCRVMQSQRVVVPLGPGWPKVKSPHCHGHFLDDLVLAAHSQPHLPHRVVLKIKWRRGEYKPLRVTKEEKGRA